MHAVNSTLTAMQIYEFQKHDSDFIIDFTMFQIRLFNKYLDVFKKMMFSFTFVIYVLYFSSIYLLAIVNKRQ